MAGYRRAASPTTMAKADRGRPSADRLKNPQNAGIDWQNQYVAARNRFAGLGTPLSGSVPGQNIRKTALKVIASSIRKGNVIEQDGMFYDAATAENIHP